MDESTKMAIDEKIANDNKSQQQPVFDNPHKDQSCTSVALTGLLVCGGLLSIPGILLLGLASFLDKKTNTPICGKEGGIKGLTGQCMNVIR